MQDEQVVLNNRTQLQQNLLIEQQRGLEEFKKESSLQAKRQEKFNAIREEAKPKDIHVERVVPPAPEVYQARMEQEQRDREARDRLAQGFDPETSIDTPASIFHEIHGETMLRNVMDLGMDNAQTEFINNYVLQKMRVGKMQDTQQNYEKVLDRLLSKNNLSRNQQKAYVMNKLYLSLYLNNHDLDEEDNLLLSIINRKGAKRHGVRR